MSRFEVIIVKNGQTNLEEMLHHLGCEVKIHYQLNTQNPQPPRGLTAPHLRASSDTANENAHQLIQMLERFLAFQGFSANAPTTEPPNLLPTPIHAESLSGRGRSSRMKDCLFLKKNCRYVKVPVKNICWIEACRSSLVVHLECGKKIVLTTNLKTFSAQYKHVDLIRVHRSFILNLQKVEAIYGRSLIIKDKAIPFSDSYISDISALFPVIRSKV